ncbi:hypothetical protein VIGAN_03063100 [Vigna angularis var. angularis]|uniref:Uncharacterized protein n=1 Tax=Vigna angularis var. angularis TaxID=157739 RepID=A0A0S3RK81_PHAAN|nr:hypothetical protein VIGAN_03063100 [Vigna angularis var. angularis]
MKLSNYKVKHVRCSITISNIQTKLLLVYYERDTVRSFTKGSLSFCFLHGRECVWRSRFFHLQFMTFLILIRFCYS